MGKGKRKRETDVTAEDLVKMAHLSIKVATESIIQGEFIIKLMQSERTPGRTKVIRITRSANAAARKHIRSAIRLRDSALAELAKGRLA